MDATKRARGLELTALALASFSVLGSQIAMTRILSLKYAANQTFLVVSFAVLGLAIGAAVAHRLRATPRLESELPASGMALFAVSLGLLLGSFYLDLSAGQQIGLVPLPFIGVGVCIASVFARRSGQAGLYYASDLGGAALGAFGAAPILDMVPAPTAMLLFTLSGVVASALFLRGVGPLVRTTASALVLAAGVGVVSLALPGRVLGRIPIHPDRIKDMVMYVADARRQELDRDRWPFLERSRWSAFGRTDVINDTKRLQKKVLFVDGAAGSPMFAETRELEPEARRYLEIAFGPSVALRLTPPAAKRTALAIGSGGGRDVVAARMAGVGRITAVELNPDVVAIVREEAEFNGGVYANAPDVDVVVEEGRHFLRRSPNTYDVLLLSIPVTKRGEGYGGFALSESYLFTRESMGEYLDRLNPGGQLLIVCHTRQEVGRLINTYLEAERADGVTPVEAMQRLAVYGESLLTVLITAEPRPDAFWGRLQRETRRLGLARPERLFYYVPGPQGLAGPGATPALAAVASGAAPAVVFPRQSGSSFEPDMSPVTDDRPFFYFFTETLPPMIRIVLTASAGALIVMLLWGVLGPVGATAPGDAGALEVLLWRLAVAGLGVAFMLVEIAFIQRFVFWFGRPTLALGLLLGMLLLATGLGALIAGAFIGGKLERTWPLVAVLGVLLVVALRPAQTVLFEDAGGEFVDALVRSVAITGPLGLLMGVPFPMLLTAAGRRGGVSVAWLWGVNGVGSVLGSAGAVATAMLLGYATAMLLAGGVYGLTAIVILVLARKTAASNASDD